MVMLITICYDNKKVDNQLLEQISLVRRLNYYKQKDIVKKNLTINHIDIYFNKFSRQK